MILREYVDRLRELRIFCESEREIFARRKWTKKVEEEMDYAMLEVWKKELKLLQDLKQ